MKKFIVFEDDYCGATYVICKTRADAEEFILSMIEEELYISMNEDINCLQQGWNVGDTIEEWYESFNFEGSTHTKWGNLLCMWGGLAISEIEELD